MRVHFRKGSLSALLTVVLATFAFSQVVITGSVKDENSLPLSGADITVVGEMSKTTTDLNGDFNITTTNSEGLLEIVDAITGSKQIRFNSKGASALNLGTIILKGDGVDLAQMILVGTGVVDFVKDRETPVAATTISAKEIQEKVGNMEFPELLNKTPSVYATKGSGGFGDSRINVRGFDQTNIAVIINGQPVNDMENGRVYWSNWAGLSDVASAVQVQRGLGASKLAVPSVGGTINVLTRSADKLQGGTLKVIAGNNGYYKTVAEYNTGLNDNGWSASVLLGKTGGNGYIKGLEFSGYTYLASIGYKVSDNHNFNFNLTGAAQWHNKRSTNVSIRDFMRFGGDDFRKFNPDLGYRNGKLYTLRKNFYNKPIASFNWDWKINEKLKLSSVLYGSWGRGGGTGDRGKNYGVNPYKSDLSAAIDDGKLPYRDAQTGEILFDKIVENNKSGTAFSLANNPYNGLIIGSNGYEENGVNKNILIRRASMNSHDWYGAISNLKYEYDNWTFGAGIDLRAYKGYHYRVLSDLLGLDGYYSTGNKNLDTGVIVTETYEAKPFANTGLGGQKIDFYSVGDVKWGGFNVIGEYKGDKVSAVFQSGLSNQSYKRTDYFDQPLNFESDTKNMLGGFAKGGVNYNINSQHNVFVNTGYIERQPKFDEVFSNYKNIVNDKVKNEKIVSYELGYGFKTHLLNVSLNLYSTTWSNRSFSKEFTLEGGAKGTANFSGIEQNHRGIELETKLNLARWLRVTSMLSIGNWVYTKDINASVFDDNQNKIGEKALYLKGTKVGDAAQTTANIGVEVKPINKLAIDASWQYANNLYGNFNIERDNSFLKSDNKGPIKLPSYSLFDAGVSYKFKLTNNKNLGLRFNVNNLFDTEYISEANTNIHAEAGSKTYKGIDERNFVWFGYGRTWNLSLRYEF